jgi:putative phage-type endonuclease
MEAAEIIQGSDEWKRLRAGKVTASRVADLIAKTKSGWGASRANYMADLIAERLTGESATMFVNDAMRWGTEQEPNARAAYEFKHDCEVFAIGFAAHPAIPDSGASPDGLVGDDGMVEFKCPNTATHIDTLLGQTVPAKYNTQMQWQMACTGRKWCDWVSFDPRMPEAMKLYVQRVERDDEMIAGLEKDVRDFLGELAKRIAQLLSLQNKAAA